MRKLAKEIFFLKKTLLFENVHKKSAYAQAIKYKNKRLLVWFILIYTGKNEDEFFSDDWVNKGVAKKKRSENGENQSENTAVKFSVDIIDQ